MSASTKAKSAKPEENTIKLVKLQIRGGHGDWTINSENGVYQSVNGIIEVPADIASRLEGDTDYEIVG